MKRHHSVRPDVTRDISPSAMTKANNPHYHDFITDLKRLKEKRREIEAQNKNLKNKVELLEKEDKKIIDKIFYIKNLQGKVTKAREAIKTNKEQKKQRLKSENKYVNELKMRNFEFKKGMQISKQKAIEALKLEKDNLGKEGRKNRQKAIKLKEKREKKLKVKVRTMKDDNNIGRLWLKHKQEERSQLLAERMLIEQKNELNRLKKAEKTLKAVQMKEQNVLDRYKRDQKYQEAALDEFKNTINDA